MGFFKIGDTSPALNMVIVKFLNNVNTDCRDVILSTSYGLVSLPCIAQFYFVCYAPRFDYSRFLLHHYGTDYNTRTQI